MTDASRRSGALGKVTIATIIAAASGYLVLLLAARDLGAAGYGVFAVFWAAYGMVTGAQNGQLQETTRAVRATSGDTGGVAAPGARCRPWLVNGCIGLLLGLLVAATSPLWSGHVFTEYRALSVVLLSIGVASFAVYAHLAGALSGSVSWGTFAMLMSIDALIRLVASVVVVVVGGGLTAFLVITVVGSVSWMILLSTSASARHAVGLPGDVATRRFTGNTVTAMAAAAASAVLVMGFPVLIKATGGHHPGDTATVGAVVLAVTLTRAPLLVPLNSFQGVLITRFVDGRHRLGSALAIPLGVVAGIGILGAVAAWAVGPWLLGNVFGASFRLPGASIAWFTFGATTLALLTVTGAAAIAVGAHRWYAAGWWAATIASIGLLLLPLGVADRVAIALIAGPVVGMVVHLSGLAARSRLIAETARV